MFKLKTFLVKERVGFLKLVDTFDIYDPATGAQVGIARENISIFVKLLRFLVNKRLLPTTVGLAPAIRSAPHRFPAIAVFPQVPPDSQWVGTSAEVALAALRQTMAEFQTDARRVYLTGLSMGGHGTWYLAYRHPELFTAIAPICGWVTDLPRFVGSVPVVPPDSGPPLPALARRLAGMPVWIFHGEMDAVVPVSGSREPAAALQAASPEVRYTEYLGLNHNSWDATYASDQFTRWLFAQRRR